MQMGGQFTTILSVDLIAGEDLKEAEERATALNLDEGFELIAGQIVDHNGDLVKSTASGLIAQFGDLAEAVECALAIWTGASQSGDHVWKAWIGICDGGSGSDGGPLESDGPAVVRQIKSRFRSNGIYLATRNIDRIKRQVATEITTLDPQDIVIADKPVPVYRLTPSGEGSAPGEAVTSKTAIAWRQLTWAISALLVIAVVAFGAWMWRWEPQIAAPPAGTTPASVEAMAFPLPDKPSIAVLPFDHLGEDSDDRHFGDGLTEDLITSLSQISALFVVARNSTFVYRGKPVNIPQIAEELGVRYVLEGSIQVSGNEVRITAQLIDALSGTHIWAEKYDRELTGLFELQDAITTEIVAALRVNLTEGEEVRVHRKNTSSIEAWNQLGRGMEHFYRGNKVDNLAARRFFEKAIEIDENYAVAHTLLAWTHWFDAFRGYSKDAAKSVELANSLAQKALAIDGDFPDVHALQGAIHLLNRQHDEAIASARRAVEYNPNHATNTALLAMILHNSGELDEAISTYKRAMRLSPYYPDWFLEELGFTYLDAGRHAEAIVAMKEFIKREPSSEHLAHARIALALTYHAQGKYAEARAEIDKAKEALPGLTTTYFLGHALNRDQSDPEQALKILQALGLPE